MEQENYNVEQPEKKGLSPEGKARLIKYAVCFGVASLITFIIFWVKGFFTDNTGVNIQILSDGFCVSGLMLTMFAGMMFISGEGALIGIGFVMKSVVNTFIPMGRKNHETYKQYRERKIGNVKKASDNCILFTGLFFLLIGVIFTVIWYTNFYNVSP